MARVANSRPGVSKLNIRSIRRTSSRYIRVSLATAWTYYSEAVSKAYAWEENSQRQPTSLWCYLHSCRKVEPGAPPPPVVWTRWSQVWLLCARHQEITPPCMSYFFIHQQLEDWAISAEIPHNCQNESSHVNVLQIRRDSARFISRNRQSYWGIALSSTVARPWNASLESNRLYFDLICIIFNIIFLFTYVWCSNQWVLHTSFCLARFMILSSTEKNHYPARRGSS